MDITHEELRQEIRWEIENARHRSFVRGCQAVCWFLWVLIIVLALIATQL